MKGHCETVTKRAAEPLEVPRDIMFHVVTRKAFDEQRNGSAMRVRRMVSASSELEAGAAHRICNKHKFSIRQVLLCIKQQHMCRSGPLSMQSEGGHKAGR